MDYQMIATWAWLGLFFILLRKQFARLIMTLIKAFQKKKHTDSYQKFIEYWSMFGGIICLILAIQEIFN